MFRSVLSALFLLACGVLAAKPLPVREIGIEEAVNLALLNNRQVMSARIEINNREAGLSLTRNGFRLRINPEARGDFAEDTQSFFYGLSAERKLPWGTQVKGQSGYRSIDVAGTERSGGGVVRVELNQPLFRNMGRKMTLEPVFQAGNDLMQSQRLLYIRQAEIMLEVLRSYERIFLLHKSIGSAEASLKRLDGLMVLSKTREARGKQTRVDSLRVELQRGQAEVRLRNDREQYATEVENFQDLLNTREPVKLKPRARRPMALELPAFEDAIEVALSRRLDYAQAFDAYRDAHRRVDIARRRLWPDLQLTGTWERSADDQDDPFRLNDSNWFAGLRLASGYQPRDERLVIRQAGNNRELARLDIEDRRFVIAREVRREIRSYRRARANVDITGRNLELARKRVELARALYELGRGDNFSVTDAESALTEAETDAYTAEAESTLAGYRVMNTLGILVDVPAELLPDPVNYDD